MLESERPTLARKADCTDDDSWGKFVYSGTDHRLSIKKYNDGTISWAKLFDSSGALSGTMEILGMVDKHLDGVGMTIEVIHPPGEPDDVRDLWDCRDRHLDFHSEEGFGVVHKQRLVATTLAGEIELSTSEVHEMEVSLYAGGRCPTRSKQQSKQQTKVNNLEILRSTQGGTCNTRKCKLIKYGGALIGV